MALTTICPRVARRALLLLAAVIPAAAHDGEPLQPHDLLTAWTWEPVTVLCLGLSAWLYFRGSRPLWRGNKPGHGVRPWQAACFWAGWVTLFLALLSPLHPLGEALFSAHMAQHELLMAVAAPLMVLGRPLAPFLWGLPISWRRKLGRGARVGFVRATWRWITTPAVAWALQAIVLLGWHAPALYDAAVESEFIHALQHVSFLGAALLFWWALIYGRRGRMGYGASVMYVFTTLIYSGGLGALLTFAPDVLYPAYATSTAAWGLTPLQDQQLAGLIMWVPAGLIYVFAALILFALWLRESEPGYSEVSVAITADRSL